MRFNQSQSDFKNNGTSGIRFSSLERVGPSPSSRSI